MRGTVGPALQEGYWPAVGLQEQSATDSTATAREVYCSTALEVKRQARCQQGWFLLSYEGESLGFLGL